MEIFQALAKHDHEQVVHCYDPESDLKAIIAIHNTTLGPALGGCRMWPYQTEEEALTDVLRLSRGMTYKSAVAGLNLGGGKAVIIGDPSKLKTEKLFRAFGRFVHSLGGRYITAEDVNTTVDDMEWVRMETEFVTGIRRVHGGSGDPSPITAYGVFHGMKAAMEWVGGSNSLNGVTVAMQGVGQVGFYLLEHLIPAGAKVIAADIKEANIARVRKDYPQVEFVSPDAIYDVPCEIFAPCAMGGVVNSDTIPRLKCKIIAGSANNVLLHDHEHSAQLEAKNITYVPDFVISSGGLINVSNELAGYDRKHVLQITEGVGKTVREILEIAKEHNCTTSEASFKLAKNRIEHIGNLKPRFLGVSRRKTGRGII